MRGASAEFGEITDLPSGLVYDTHSLSQRNGISVTKDGSESKVIGQDSSRAHVHTVLSRRYRGFEENFGGSEGLFSGGEGGL